MPASAGGLGGEWCAGNSRTVLNDLDRCAHAAASRGCLGSGTAEAGGEPGRRRLTAGEHRPGLAGDQYKRAAAEDGRPDVGWGLRRGRVRVVGGWGGAGWGLRCGRVRMADGWGGAGWVSGRSGGLGVCHQSFTSQVPRAIRKNGALPRMVGMMSPPGG
ncbi:hypothetical protein GCM10022380_46680 [Amycolatopsis tucumanensis]|uniref:Uncharacterized protein n=1 Tax=Amycolatopsis tucumanensis TaxID=401106 RepID=A0ABP7IMP0_9PSEU